MKKIFVDIMCLFISLNTISQPGLLDHSFGNNGYIVSQLKSNPFLSMAVQADGKIIIAGTSSLGENPAKNVFNVTRYNSDGSPDLSFGQDGLVTEDFGTSRFAMANDVVTQSDGKIVVAGVADFAFNYAFAIARYNADGSLDLNFSEDGILTTDIGPAFERLNSIAIQPDGKIVAVGLAWIGGVENLAIARYNSDGSLDMSFDGDGLLTTSLGTIHNEGLLVKIQPDGKIVVCGNGYFVNTGTDFIIARLNSNGSLDLSFNENGFRIIDFGGYYDYPTAIEIQYDGKIVVAGRRSLQDDVDEDFAIARCNADGSLDLSFDDDGLLTTDFQNLRDEALSVSLHVDGKIIVAGHSGGKLAIAKYNSNGSLDLGFGEDGKVVSDFGIPGYSSMINCIALHDNRIYVGGYRVSLADSYGLAAAYYADNVCATSVNITDAYSVNPGGNVNTVYIGYQPASSITLTATASGGNAPYSYSWSTVQSTQQITVSPTIAGVYNYNVTVTDASGCTAQFSKTITAVNIISGQNLDKVYICHRDLKGKWTTLSVLQGSVANHLAHGDYLGICNNNSSNSEILTRAASETGDQEIIQKGFKIYPNPATHFLDVQWTTKNTSQTSIRILNAEGKTVKTITTQGAVNQQRISLNGLAKGIYMLVLKTGPDQQVSKFVIR